MSLQTVGGIAFHFLPSRPLEIEISDSPLTSDDVSIADLWRLRDVFVEQFIQSFATAPRHLTLDVDAFDDPAHGPPQLTFFHGYYGANQYLPIVFTSAENDAVVLIGLRHGTCGAALGADDDVRYLTGRLRAVRPDVSIHLRGDCGFGVPSMYDAYAERGESENRDKELKCDLQADRLSDRRFVANYFRLYLHAAALNLLVRLRRAIALPTPTPADLELTTTLPESALCEPLRRQFFNRRRLWDPPGSGCAGTWRTRLIKVAAEVITRARRVSIRLSATWPYLEAFRKVSATILSLKSPGKATG